MCGITGFWVTSASSDLEEIANRMAMAIRYRGPDDSGTWSDGTAGVAFGFRRLAIIDLSEQGHQPMVSASGRFVIIFNGEVFNFRAIRNELEGRGALFRGHSDTEVMLAAFEAWGIENAVRRFVGMFAIAVWDTPSEASRRISGINLSVSFATRILLPTTVLPWLRPSLCWRYSETCGASCD